MKSIKFCAIFVALTLLTVSCVEKSQKYKTVVAQRDSIAIEKQALDSSYNQTLSLLNEIETGFADINKGEKQMMLDLKGTEGKAMNQRDRIVSQMKAIKENLEQNKAKIASLRNLVSKGEKANSLLTETINRLQSKMDEQVAQIKSIQAELAQKNSTIGELTTTVTNQKSAIEQQKTAISQQGNTIAEQVIEKNTVWYCIATSKQLKTAKIITDAGLFSSKKLMVSEFDKTLFTKVDLRNTSSIATNSKRVKLLSPHPQSSYQLVTGADKIITITITDPAKFWSISKYLVVQK